MARDRRSRDVEESTDHGRGFGVAMSLGKGREAADVGEEEPSIRGWRGFVGRVKGHDGRW
jgi:hypothetical protein